MKRTFEILAIAFAALVIVSIPAYGATPTQTLDTSDTADKTAEDEWHIDLSDHWRNSISDDDRRVMGYVTTVEPPFFTLRTHADGIMSFVIPDTTEYADDLRTGNRIQVWYDPQDTMTDAAGEVWMIIHGFGVHLADLEQNTEARNAEMKKMSKNEAGSVETDAAQAVQNTALPPSAEPGPGPSAYTLTGTILEFDEDSMVIDTVVGPRVVRIVNETQTMTELEKGLVVAIEFHRGGPTIHAKVIRKAAESS